MHLDAGVPLATVAAADGDMHQPRGAPAHAVRVAGAVMAEERVVAEREHCRPPAPVGPEQRVADRVDAAMDGVEAADLAAILDRLW